MQLNQECAANLAHLGASGMVKMPVLIFAQKLAGWTQNERYLFICLHHADWNSHSLPAGIMRREGLSDVKYANLSLSVA